MVKLSAVLVALAAIGANAHDYKAENYACSVCEQVLGAGKEAFQETCESFKACHMFDESMLEGNDGVGAIDNCQRLGLCPLDEAWMSQVDPVDIPFDLRVAKAHADNGYAKLRVSAIVNSTLASNDKKLSYTKANGEEVEFDYDADFKYRWTDMHLSSTLVDVVPGQTTHIDIMGVDVPLYIPEDTAPTRGIIIADPCFSSRWVWCSYGDEFQTFDRQTKFLNAMSENDNDTIDYFMILGDNFYDRDGFLTSTWFRQLSVKARSKAFATALGNHDYWVHGAPIIGMKADDYGNGKMQFYAQDTVSSVIDPVNFLNFTVDPDMESKVIDRRPDPSNFVWHHKMGNTGFIGYSGAYSFDSVKDYFMDACQAMGQAPIPEATFIVGHWNTPALGCPSDMTVPNVFEEIKTFPGCDVLGDSLRYVMGHTHCNEITTEGVGYMVAGQGMSGCHNFGIPVIDTFRDRLTIQYFPLDNATLWDQAYDCIAQQGYSNCLQYAETWLDAPYRSASSSSA